MSGEFKGTPGPWHVMRGDVLDKNGRMVASIEGFCPGEAEIYDAQLISAAPELLQSLREMIGSLGVMVKDPENCPEIIKARAAIAKALGETQ